MDALQIPVWTRLILTVLVRKSSSLSLTLCALFTRRYLAKWWTFSQDSLAIAVLIQLNNNDPTNFMPPISISLFSLWCAWYLSISLKVAFQIWKTHLFSIQSPCHRTGFQSEKEQRTIIINMLTLDSLLTILYCQDVERCIDLSSEILTPILLPSDQDLWFDAKTILVAEPSTKVVWLP